MITQPQVEIITPMGDQVYSCLTTCEPLDPCSFCGALLPAREMIPWPTPEGGTGLICTDCHKETCIILKLDTLAILRADVEELAAQRQTLIDASLPPDVRSQLQDMESQDQAIQRNITYVECRIKEEIVAGGRTIQGKSLLGVYGKGRVSWDDKGLSGYALAHPETVQAMRDEIKRREHARRNAYDKYGHGTGAARDFDLMRVRDMFAQEIRDLRGARDYYRGKAPARYQEMKARLESVVGLAEDLKLIKRRAGG